MTQKFSIAEFENFKNHFKVKDSPGKNDVLLINKTKKYLKFISFIPGIRLIAVGNSIGFNTSNHDSDIDLFIVTDKNRMWIVRILVTLIFSLLGVRKTQSKHAGNFCLSFFCTTDGMDFSSFAIEKDIYLYFWIIYLKPIFDVNNTFDKFISSQSWADFTEYTDIIEKNKEYIMNNPSPTLPLSIMEGSKSRFFDKIDNLLKNIFLPKTLKHYNKLQKPFGIIINDDMLKFHNDDIREKIKKDLLK